MVVVIFLLLGLIFAAICGVLDNKNTDKAEKTAKILRIISIFCLAAAVISLIVIVGPDKSSGGTKMTAAMGKLSGGWAGAIVVGFIAFAVLNLLSMGIRALARKITR